MGSSSVFHDIEAGKEITSDRRHVDAHHAPLVEDGVASADPAQGGHKVVSQVAEIGHMLFIVIVLPQDRRYLPVAAHGSPSVHQIGQKLLGPAVTEVQGPVMEEYFEIPEGNDLQHIIFQKASGRKARRRDDPGLSNILQFLPDPFHSQGQDHIAGAVQAVGLSGILPILCTDHDVQILPDIPQDPCHLDPRLGRCMYAKDYSIDGVLRQI